MTLEINSFWNKNSMQRFGRWREKLISNITDHRWLLLLFLSVFVLIFELLENLNTQQPIDAHFLRELLFFGAVYPVVTFWLLNKLFVAQTERNNIAWQQERSRQLKQALAQAHDLDDLHKTIVAFPETVAPTLGVALYRPIPETNRLELAAERWRQWDGGKRPFLLPITITANACSQTKHTPERGLHPIPPASGEEAVHQAYCVPLMRGDALDGILRIYLPPMSMLTTDQIAVFNQTSAAIALALGSATPQNIELIRAGAARSERDRIARHLHDTLGQKLAYLQVMLTNLASDHPGVDLSSIQEELEVALGVSNEAYQQVRATLLVMRSDDQENLADALLNQAKAMAKTAEFDLRYTLEGQPQMLPPLIRRKILFIFREALHNIQRHACATAVNLDIIWQEQALNVSLRDNGAGFNPKNGIPTGHFGLLIMAQRAEEIDAELAIASGEGQGTHVCLCYPLPPD